ncbi:MAG: citrate synthase [Candidatus Hydrothermarchaeales archaeon]
MRLNTGDGKMEGTQETKNIGLRGVVIADTRISLVEGDEGRLVYRGYDINELAKYSTFEETVYLLHQGDLPNKQALEDFSRRMADARELPPGIIEILQRLPKSTHPMDVLQSTLAALAGYDSKARDKSKEANVETAIKIIAKTPTIVAYWDRIRKGLDLKKPKQNLSHAANFLYMLNGEEPDDETANELDICLILHADHSFNASTFAAREVTSTRAHMYASISAGTGALSGELHGGANAKVMEMLQGIDDIGAVDEWVKARFDAHERIMGMGHAVYRTTDPRSTILAEMSERLGKRKGEPRWYEISKRIEEATREEFRNRKGGEIYPNVDLYSASVYYLMGIDSDLFTPIFAISRVAGWCAHVIEEKFAEAQPKPALYRPESTYVGEYCGLTGCKYVPIGERSEET